MIARDLVFSGGGARKALGTHLGSSVRFPASYVSLAMLLVCGLTAARAAAQAAPQDAQPQAAAPAAATSRPAAPVVTYRDGQLTIIAENVTLSEIMSALHSAMGTQVDLPAGSSTERIWAHLGPGSAHKVLSELLGNTDLNYIIQGSPSDAGAIESVTLSVRTPDGGPGKAGSPVEAALARRGARVAPSPEPEPTPEPTPAPQETAAAAPSTPPATQPADAAPSAAATSPDAVTPHEPASASMAPTGTPNINPETPQPSAGSFNPHPSPPPSMSTDQMVQQLANMYQQRRQMQQGQGGSTPN